MPIRFRCVFCSRLLGIATRKAGSATRCPQCGNEIVVPGQSEDEAASPPSAAEPVAATGSSQAVAVRPKAAKPRPTAKLENDPLFIEEDLDELLGVRKNAKLLPSPPTGSKPVSGLDALSLGDADANPAGMILSPQRLTLIVVALVLVLLVTFAAGVFLGMNTTRAA